MAGRVAISLEACLPACIGCGERKLRASGEFY